MKHLVMYEIAHDNSTAPIESKVIYIILIAYELQILESLPT